MKGIRRHGKGWQARASVRGVGRVFQPFPLETPEEEMQAWRRAASAALELQRDPTKDPASAGTFAADVERYLKAVAAMPDIKNRSRDIGEWLAKFGKKRSQTIKGHEIRAQRDSWLLRGPKQKYNRRKCEFELVDEPLAASTVNHRLRALENFFTVLYPSWPNPVREVPEAQEPPAQDRSLPYGVIELVLRTMPDRGKPRKGERRPGLSLAKVRLRLMAYAGLPPAQMMALRGPNDFDFETPAIYHAPRKKGRGAEGGWRPVPIEAIPAMRAFVEARAFGKFSRDSVRQSWQRACAKLKLPRIRPYDIRHSFATQVLEQTKDLEATQALLDHADARTTKRYANAALPAWMSAAAQKVRFRA